MRRILGHIMRSAIFLSLLMVMLIFLSKVAVPKANVKEQGMEDPMANGILSEPAETLDVVVLGDSEAYCAISPLQIYKNTGITSYICATSGQRLWYTEEFLYKTFQSQKPKIVILETDNIFKDYSFSNSAKHKADRMFPVFRYHNRWKNLSFRDFNFAVRYTYIENSKGYNFNTTIQAADDTNYMVPTDELQAFPERNKSFIKNMRDFCRENDTEFILLSTPSTVNWSYAKHNAIEKLAKELSVEFVDLNMLREEVPIDWKKDTRDGGDHLNHSGAVKVSDYLASYLTEKGIFIDHRGDERYEGFQTALQEYEKAIKGNE